MVIRSLGFLLVVASCSWLTPAKAQSTNPDPMVTPAVAPTVTQPATRSADPLVVQPVRRSSVAQPPTRSVTPAGSQPSVAQPATRSIAPSVPPVANSPVPPVPRTSPPGTPAATPAVAQLAPRVENLQQQADSAYLEGNAALAVNLYSQLLQQQPDSYLFQVRLAVAMLNAGPEYLTRSYEAFQKARDLNPSIDEPLVFLGRLEESQEQSAQALVNYQKAYALNPANQDAFIGIQRVQAQVALPAFPDNLAVVAERDLADYLAAIEPNSRLLEGLRSQRSIVQGFAWRSALPYLNLGYSWSHSNNISSDSNSSSDPCIGGRRQSDGQNCGNGTGNSNGFSIGVNWNLTELFANSNQFRLRLFEDEIKKNLSELKTETQRLFSTRRSLLEEFRELSWRAALNPTDPAIRYSRRDRYLQILYVSQQIYNITGLY